MQAYWVEELDSTNRLVWDWLDHPKTALDALNPEQVKTLDLPALTQIPHLTPEIVVIAAQQTAGRGQFQRTWQSLAGGLYLSLGVQLHLTAQEALRLNFGSAWGVAKALQRLGIPAQIKWPNDLVLTGRKLGGLLIETRMQRQQAVIGLGLNWCNPVPTIGIALQPYLQQRGEAPITSLTELTTIVLQGLFQGYQRWLDLGVTIEHLLPDYLALLTTLGQWIPLRSTEKFQFEASLEGEMAKVIGVAPTGELRVVVGERDREILLPPGSVHIGYETPAFLIY
jgi:BirA family biotin operon repressor/biotin-[acetyl-CoA-carboxylase] ligase